MGCPNPLVNDHILGQQSQLPGLTSIQNGVIDCSTPDAEQSGQDGLIHLVGEFPLQVTQHTQGALPMSAKVLLHPRQSLSRLICPLISSSEQGQLLLVCSSSGLVTVCVEMLRALLVPFSSVTVCVDTDTVALCWVRLCDILNRHGSCCFASFFLFLEKTLHHTM